MAQVLYESGAMATTSRRTSTSHRQRRDLAITRAFKALIDGRKPDIVQPDVTVKEFSE